jgi:phosphatidylserine/phosphatidylglycerophosphate/cardiolipin synthase-like enzyme
MNLEINAVILDQEFGDEMEQTFYRDLKNSSELKLDEWQKRPLLHFIAEWFCYRFRNYL